MEKGKNEKEKRQKIKRDKKYRNTVKKKMNYSFNKHR
jgi:hypothetical protein